MGRWLELLPDEVDPVAPWGEGDAEGQDEEIKNASDDASVFSSEPIERAVRALRAAARRWAEPNVPLIRWPSLETAAPRERVLERIDRYLQALATASNADIAMLVRGGEHVASSAEATELQTERLPFLLRQVAADGAARHGTSFGDVCAEDFYARTFWVDSAVVLFFSTKFAPDFVRHRVKLVCRGTKPFAPAPGRAAPGSRKRRTNS